MILKMIWATAEPLTRQGERKVYPYLFDFDFDTFTGTDKMSEGEREPSSLNKTQLRKRSDTR